MELSATELQNIIPKELLMDAELDVKQTKNQKKISSQANLITIDEDMKLDHQPDFVKIETDLVALGFFTPSSKKIKNVKEKTIVIIRRTDGEKTPLFINIIPSAK